MNIRELIAQNKLKFKDDFRIKEIRTIVTVNQKSNNSSSESSGGFVNSDLYDSTKIGRAIGVDSENQLYFEEGEFLNEGTCMDGFGRRFDSFWLE